MNYISLIDSDLKTIGFYFLLLEIFSLPFSYEISTISLLSAFSIYLLDGFKHKFSFYRTKVDYSILIFAIFSIVSIFVSGDKVFSAYNFFNVAGRYLLTFFLVVQMYPREDENIDKKIILVLLASYLIVCLYGFWQILLNHRDIEQGLWVDSEVFKNIKMRMYSTWYNPNLFGGYLDILLSIIASLFSFSYKGKAKSVLLFLFILGFVCLFLTYARGSIIALVLVLGIYFLLKKRSLFLGLLILVGSLFILNPGIVERFSLNLYNMDTSSQMRLAFFNSTMHMIKDHPLLGIGWGQFYAVYPMYDYYMQGEIIRIVHAHNMYLNIWAEVGIFGLLGYLYTFFKTIVEGLTGNQNPLYIGISLGMLAISINGLTDFVLFNIELSMLLWCLMGLVWAKEAKSNEGK